MAQLRLAEGSVVGPRMLVARKLATASARAAPASARRWVFEVRVDPWSRSCQRDRSKQNDAGPLGIFDELLSRGSVPEQEPDPIGE